MTVTAAHTGLMVIAYHQFWIGDVAGDIGAEPSNGLIHAVGTSAVVYTGTAAGVVTLTVEVLTGAPVSVPADWDDIHEVSVGGSPGELYVHALMADIPEPFPVLNPTRAAAVRIRVSVRGRDTDPDGTAFEPREDYLIQAWAADVSTPHSLKQSDGYGAMWRSQTGQVNRTGSTAGGRGLVERSRPRVVAYKPPAVSGDVVEPVEETPAGGSPPFVVIASRTAARHPDIERETDEG